MKVIGAGFGRTGTLSLKAALEELGFGPCYHMKEALAHPSHLFFWNAASKGKAVDWKQHFLPYQATVDWPACKFYKELMLEYPDAKVLLSVRDPEKWYDSARDTIYKVGKTFPMSWLRSFFPVDLIWKDTFDGRFEDRRYAIQVFNRHVEEVKRHVPADKLLVYEVKDGWEPLCRFLDVPVPQGKPFPRLNDTAEFERIIRRGALVGKVLMGALVLLVAGVVYFQL